MERGRRNTPSTGSRRATGWRPICGQHTASGNGWVLTIRDGQCRFDGCRWGDPKPWWVFTELSPQIGYFGPSPVQRRVAAYSSGVMHYTPRLTGSRWPDCLAYHTLNGN